MTGLYRTLKKTLLGGGLHDAPLNKRKLSSGELASINSQMGASKAAARRRRGTQPVTMLGGPQDRLGG